MVPVSVTHKGLIAGCLAVTPQWWKHHGHRGEAAARWPQSTPMASTLAPVLRKPRGPLRASREMSACRRQVRPSFSVADLLYCFPLGGTFPAAPCPVCSVGHPEVSQLRDAGAVLLPQPNGPSVLFAPL